IHIEIDSNHQSFAIVVNSTPLRGALHLRHYPSSRSDAQMTAAWNLSPLVQIEKNVEQRIIIRDVDNWPIGKDALDAGFKNPPIIGAVKIIDHQKSAANQVFPHS